jgi:hypothetical protein
MAKTIDVTFATMRNVGPVGVSPKGVIWGQTVRAVSDEEIHQSEVLYSRLQPGQPMHPSGATNIQPGQALSFNVTKRLTVHSDEMLMFSRDLKESEDEIYQGSFNRKVRFEEIEGITTVSCDYRVVHGGQETRKIVVDFIVNLISG